MKALLFPVLISLLLGAQLVSAQNQQPILAVMEFDMAATHRAGRTLGNGLSDMLTNALVEDGSFRVVERKRINEILQEQDLGLDGVVSASTTASIGRMVGANYLVMGTITEYKENESGGAASALLGAAVGGVKMYKSHIGYTIRIVNSSSGEILVSKSVDKKVSSVGLARRGIWGITPSGSMYKSQSMQDAIEQSIIETVGIIKQEISELPEVDPSAVINAVEVVAAGVDFMQFKAISDYLEASEGVSHLQKNMENNVATLFFQYKGPTEEVAEYLMNAPRFQANITTFTSNKIEMEIL
ncbi:MAG: CsgG/HfaB family protein [Cyclobacteriaceae bacterium]